MQNHVIVRLEGIGAFRVQCDVARRLLEEPARYLGSLPANERAGVPDVYVTTPTGITFAPRGDDYCIWDYGNFPCVEAESGSPFGLGYPLPFA